MGRTITLSVHSAHDLQDKISAIRSIRALTGQSLREAKDLVERIKPGHFEIIKVMEPIANLDFDEHLTRIRKSGLTMVESSYNPARAGIAEGLRKLVTYANMTAQYDIGRALTTILESYCPDPSPTYLAALESLDEDEDENKVDVSRWKNIGELINKKEV